MKIINFLRGEKNSVRGYMYLVCRHELADGTGAGAGAGAGAGSEV